VTHEHGQPSWKDIDRRKLLIRPPELSGNPIGSHLVGKQEKLAKGMVNLTYEIHFFNISKGSSTSRKILRHWAEVLYFPSEGRKAADLYRP
jgi:hypothetical protein